MLQQRGLYPASSKRGLLRRFARVGSPAFYNATDTLELHYIPCAYNLSVVPTWFAESIKTFVDIQPKGKDWMRLAFLSKVLYRRKNPARIFTLCVAFWVCSASHLSPVLPYIFPMTQKVDQLNKFAGRTLTVPPSPTIFGSELPDLARTIILRSRDRQQPDHLTSSNRSRFRGVDDDDDRSSRPRRHLQHMPSSSACLTCHSPLRIDLITTEYIVYTSFLHE